MRTISGDVRKLLVRRAVTEQPVSPEKQLRAVLAPTVAEQPFEELVP